MIGRRFIFKKTIQMSLGTLLSRFLGLVRDIYLARFLGVGAIADAFNVAYRIPNTLRQIFAEGALTSALSPTVVSVVRKEGKQKVNELVTLTGIAIFVVLFVVCLVISINAQSVIWLLAPGFSPEQQLVTMGLVKIVVFFIIGISLSSLLASALLAVHKFFMQSYGQALINIFFITEALICLHFQLSVYVFACFVLLNSFLLLLAHIIAYFLAGLSFSLRGMADTKNFVLVMKKFLPCLVTCGSMHVSLIVDQIMASYLPTGSITLLTYAWALTRAPLSVFAGAFAIVLLPSMSHLAIAAPRRLGFYVLESAKLIAWITLPATLLIVLFSHKIFLTLYLSNNFTIQAVQQAAGILAAFVSGLFFFSINKILINCFNALHDVTRPTIIVLFCTIINTILNALFMRSFGAFGIALATVLATVLQTMLLLVVLSRRHRILLYFRRFGSFVMRTFVHVAFFGILLYIIYSMVRCGILSLSMRWSHFLLERVGFWFWVGPMCAVVAWLMYVTRRKFGLRIYFLD